MGLCTNAVAPLVKLLFDEVFTNKNDEYLLIIPLCAIALYFVLGIARYIHLFTQKFTVERILINIRKDLQSKFLNMSLRSHNSQESGGGGLLSRILNDVNIIQNGFYILADAIREPIVAIGLVSYIFYLDWRLALFSSTIVPILFFLLRKVTKGLRKHAGNQLVILQNFTNVLKESIDGIRTIKSYNLENHSEQKFHTVAEQYLKARRSILQREEASGPITEFMAAIIFAVIAYYTGYKIINFNASVGNFMGFITALASLQPAIKKTQDAYVKLQQTIMATTSIFDILEDSSDLEESQSPKMFNQAWQSIDFKNLGFKYSDKWILKDFNISIARGEFVAIVGASGSGKSTLASLLSRFFDPSQGNISIGGIDLKDLRLKDLRQNIALVSQDVFLFNESIRNNIEMGNTLQSADYKEAAKLANAHDFIKRLPEGYDTRAGDRGALLSGGERQRISIARAIYKNSSILILDEATSALDSASEIEVQKGLEHLMQGKTSIVIAHRLSTIAKADRIIVLKDGQIVEQGTHKELLSLNSEYANFCRLQNSI